MKWIQLIPTIYSTQTFSSIVFSAAHRTFAEADLTLGHKAFNKYKKTEINPCVLSDKMISATTETSENIHSHRNQTIDY